MIKETFETKKVGVERKRYISKLNNFIRNNLLGAIIGGLIFGASGVIADTLVRSDDVNYDNTSNVKTAVDDLYNLQKNRIWETVYPVGSIYTSVNSTNPGELFGGTWEEFGQGRTLVGMGSNGTTNYNIVEKTGGSETKTIAVENMPAHTHSVSAFNTGNQSANHTHTLPAFNTDSKGSHSHTVRFAEDGGIVSGNLWMSTPASTTAHVQKNGPYGGSSGTPTTGDAGAHTHYVSAKNTGANSANHHHQVPAHNTNSTGSGTALNTQDPYITVYMWKRVE